MRTFKVISILIVFIVYCSMVDNCYAGKKYHTGRGSLGVYIIKNKNNEIEITDIGKETSAEKAGLEKGDIILGINDKSFQGVGDAEVLEVLKSFKPSTYIKIKIKRGEEVLEKRAKLKEREYVLSTTERIYELAIMGNKLTLIIELTQPFNYISSLPYSFNQKAWGDDAKRIIQGKLQKYFLDLEERYKNFKLYDNEKFDRDLEEMRRTSSEYDGESGKFKLMREIGITHLLIDSANRYDYKKGYEDVTEVKLIDVNTGEVVDNDRGRTTYNMRGSIIEEFHPEAEGKPFKMEKNKSKAKTRKAETIIPDKTPEQVGEYIAGMMVSEGWQIENMNKFMVQGIKQTDNAVVNFMMGTPGTNYQTFYRNIFSLAPAQGGTYVKLDQYLISSRGTGFENSQPITNKKALNSWMDNLVQYIAMQDGMNQPKTN